MKIRNVSSLSSALLLLGLFIASPLPAENAAAKPEQLWGGAALSDWNNST
jgi:hypothetical protein